jgi:hypothetical protein
VDADRGSRGCGDQDDMNRDGVCAAHMPLDYR